MPKSTQAHIHVVTKPGEELEFYVKDSLKGNELFDLVCRVIGLRESYYFGLYYEKPNKTQCWLRMDKKLRNELGGEINTVKLYLRVEFYPEDVEQGLILNITQQLFFIHVKNEILNENIYCPAGEAVLMAAFAVQAKYGDFDEELRHKDFLLDEQLLPKRVKNMYQLTDEQWVERIKSLYADHPTGLSRAEAEMEYLKIAQDLEMYGTGYYLIQNDKQTELWLGIQATGINIYSYENKLVPKVSFIWSEIKNISFKNTQILIEPMGKDVQSFCFISNDVSMNREILLLCSGNHELYLKRRKPDSLELQVMKLQANELKGERQREKKRYMKEKQRSTELEKRFKEFQTTLEKYQTHLKKAEETSDLLAEKALISEEEARLLLKKASDLETEVKRLRAALNQKDEERFFLETHIQSAGLTIQQILQESEIRSREARLLKQELDQSRNLEWLASERLLQLSANQRLASQMNTQPISNFYDDEANDKIKYLQRERVEYLEKSHHLQQQLTELKTQIEGLKITGSQDMLDRIHLENVVKGETKYSTLQKLHAASTNSRVQVYQGL
ncbi:merlin isoform X3 [Hydra vulgaris]|uniref:Merlin isoform X3 n=1 Tax=Hydra vulgaris TaxID=6087 RepID=A0ABM4CPX2_HYDVU